MGVRKFIEVFPEYNGYLKSVRERQTLTSFGYYVSHKTDQAYNRDLVRTLKCFRQYWMSALSDETDYKKVYGLGEKLAVLEKRMQDWREQNLYKRSSLPWKQRLSNSFCRSYLAKDSDLLFRLNIEVRDYLSSYLSAKTAQAKKVYNELSQLEDELKLSIPRRPSILEAVGSWQAFMFGFGFMEQRSLDETIKEKICEITANSGLGEFSADISGKEQLRVIVNKKFREPGNPERDDAHTAPHLFLAFVNSSRDMPARDKIITSNDVVVEEVSVRERNSISRIPYDWRVVSGARKLPPQPSAAELCLV
ncbi:MAG: hypothetical protein RBR86_05850 [Pseudobdellovibrionaceae bacterium]|jgi:hypothetical protein|nr:hypothetical protein [Pseudobdellovibrionaceae bacterium]